MIVPENIPGLITFFTEVLQLPVAWKYRSYGDFSSAGFYAGNVNLEIIELKGLHTKTNIGGIAFEPNGTTDEIINEMTQRKILFKEPVLHEDPEFNKKTKKKNTWTTTDLKNILPGSLIFFCEYHADSQKMESWKNYLQTKLDEQNGGPLGIEYVNEISLMIDNKKRLKDWKNLLSPVNNSPNNLLFEMGSGPAIKIVKANNNYIKSIKFKVRSMDAVFKYLKQYEIFGKKKEDVISTNPDKTYGVLFEFSEK